MTEEHPYRAALKAELDAMGEELADQLDRGHQIPFDEDVVKAAQRNFYYNRAADQADADGHRLTAWMIRRLIP